MHDLDGIYREHADMVYRFLLAKTGSADAAEELTQETFYQAVRSIGRFDGSCKISTWLCGIALNVLRSHNRKQREDLPLEDVSGPVSASAEETVVAEASQEHILTAIHGLCEPWREIVHLRLLGGLSFGQIGAIMQQSETWVRVNYYRAKQTLIKELKKDER